MKYRLSRAGSDRLRRSRALASSITASTNSGGNVLVNTPIATRSGNRPRAALTIRVTPATRKIIDHQVSKEAPLGRYPLPASKAKRSTPGTPARTATIHTPGKPPHDATRLGLDTANYHRILRSLRGLGERGFALLTGRWRGTRHTASPRSVG